MSQTVQRVVVVVAVAMLGACITPTVDMRAGVVYPPNSEGCPVEFLYQNAVNMADFENLGTTQCEGEPFSDGAKKKLSALTCKWGGDTATVQMTSTAGAVGINQTTTSYMILRKRPAGAAAAAKLACTGKYVNKDGATLDFADGSTAKMAFNGSEAPCQVVAMDAYKADLVCFGGRASGAFAGDCSSITYNGMTFNKAK